MSAVTQEFIALLHPKAKDNIRGTAKLVILDEGSVMLDHTGAYEGNGAADVILSASEDTFRAILSGAQNPVMAFMSGKLKVDGNTTRALKVSSILTS